MLSDRYSRALRAMNEPSLWELARSDKQIGAYRLLWLPTWGRPVAVRIERSGKVVTLNAVLLGGDGGYEIGELATSKRVALSERDWDTLVAGLREPDSGTCQQASTTQGSMANG